MGDRCPPLPRSLVPNVADVADFADFADVANVADVADGTTVREALNEKSRQGMEEQRKADQELQVGTCLVDCC